MVSLMKKVKPFCNSFVAACVLSAGAAFAQDAPDTDELLAQLADPETENWQQVERKLRMEWSKSGSPAMDLLLQRGRDAMQEEEWNRALEHYTALVDHAPDFAEAYSDRATVYFRLKMYGPALEDIGRALSLNPNHFNALSGLAVILEEVGMREEALEAWRMLVKIHPHNPEAQDALDRLEGEFGGQPI